MKRQPTEAQKQAAQERRAKVRALAKSIAAMPEGERAALAARVSVMTIEGRSLSLHNQLMIALQLPRATIVGGFRQWIKAGRAVRKGEHGAAIWCKAGARKVDGATPGADEDDAGAGAAYDNRFVIGTVFDVSQTDERTADTAVA